MRRIARWLLNTLAVPLLLLGGAWGLSFVRAIHIPWHRGRGTVASATLCGGELLLSIADDARAKDQFPLIYHSRPFDHRWPMDALTHPIWMGSYRRLPPVSTWRVVAAHGGAWGWPDSRVDWQVDGFIRGSTLIGFPDGEATSWSRWLLVPRWPFVACLLLILTSVLFTVRNVIARGRRARPGACAACGYDLAGNVSGVCPEMFSPL